MRVMMRSEQMHEMVRDWLRDGLRRSGKSATELAALLDIDKTAISKLLSDGPYGRRMLATEMLQIAHFLSVPLPTLDSRGGYQTGASSMHGQDSLDIDNAFAFLKGITSKSGVRKASLTLDFCDDRSATFEERAAVTGSASDDTTAARPTRGSAQRPPRKSSA